MSNTDLGPDYDEVTIHHKERCVEMVTLRLRLDALLAKGWELGPLPEYSQA